MDQTAFILLSGKSIPLKGWMKERKDKAYQGLNGAIFWDCVDFARLFSSAASE